MSNNPDTKTNPEGLAIYQIRLKGRLDCNWSDWFEGMTIRLDEEGTTLLTGPLIDQAALHGLFKKVRDLGMPLISVNHVEPELVDVPETKATHQNHLKKEKMNITKPTSGIDMKVKLSTLWIFVLLNMIYADIISLMDPASPIRRIMAGTPMPSGGLLAGAILMETSIAMVLLSRVLKHGVNRWANIVISVINIVAVVMGGQGLYYVFFATIEVVCMLFVIWYAWKWTNPEA